MAIEQANSSSSLVEVLDRVLDKGIVIDAWVRLSLVGIDLLTVEARIVVASIATYLAYSETVRNELSVPTPPRRVALVRRRSTSPKGAAPVTAARLAGSPA